MLNRSPTGKENKAVLSTLNFWVGNRVSSRTFIQLEWTSGFSPQHCKTENKKSVLARRNLLASELFGLEPQYADFHVRDPVLCLLFKLCWFPVCWSSWDNIAYLLGSHSGLNRKIVLSLASSKTPHMAEECDFYVNCEVWEAETEARHLTGAPSDDTLCQSQEQAWLPQVGEVKTELSLLRGGDLRSPDQVFWWFESIHVHTCVNPSDRTLGVCVSEYMSAILQSKTGGNFSPASPEMSISQTTEVPRAAVTEAARLRWPDRLARFLILLPLKPWPLQRQLQICCSKPAPKKKSFSHVCVN